MESARHKHPTTTTPPRLSQCYHHQPSPPPHLTSLIPTTMLPSWFSKNTTKGALGFRHHQRVRLVVLNSTKGCVGLKTRPTRVRWVTVTTQNGVFGFLISIKGAFGFLISNKRVCLVLLRTKGAYSLVTAPTGCLDLGLAA
nr:hypothetical protein [Tanacetum cinerariifolium]